MLFRNKATKRARVGVVPSWPSQADDFTFSMAQASGRWLGALVFYVCLAQTRAFLPTRQEGRKLASSKAALSDMLGGDVETFGVWDPLGFGKNESQLFRRRCVELKHGRVAMAAVVGLIVPEVVTFPGFLSPTGNIKFSDVPHGLGNSSRLLRLASAAGLAY